MKLGLSGQLVQGNTFWAQHHVLTHFSLLPREEVLSPSLEALKKCVDVAQRDMVGGCGGDG